MKIIQLANRYFKAIHKHSRSFSSASRKKISSYHYTITNRVYRLTNQVKKAPISQKLTANIYKITSQVKNSSISRKISHKVKPRYTATKSFIGNRYKQIANSEKTRSLVKKIPSLTQNNRKLIAFILAFPSLSIMTAYAVDANNQLSKPKLNKVTEVITLPEVSQAMPSQSYWKEDYVKDGDNLTRILNGVGVNENNVQNILRQNPLPKSLLKFMPGQPFSVLISEQGELSALQYFQDDDNGEKTLVAIEKKDGEWIASTELAGTETIEAIRSAIIGDSARGSLAKVDVPISVREDISEIFSDKFTLGDLRKGDKVTVLYDVIYFRGQRIGTGDIKAVEITKKGKTYKAFYQQLSAESGAYYDENGKPVVKGFQYQPVTGRISSSFGTRVHPITKRVKMHSGVDFAAPGGTPIIAPADGTVKEVGRKGGYGNAVVLQHKKGFTTLYAHMSRFASIKPGDVVTAGTVIGYVGSTGLSTGNHLHWEVRINNQPVNPITNALPTHEMPKSLFAKFKDNKAIHENKLALATDVNYNITRNE